MTACCVSGYRPLRDIRPDEATWPPVLAPAGPWEICDCAEGDVVRRVMTEGRTVTVYKTQIVGRTDEPVRVTTAGPLPLSGDVERASLGSSGRLHLSERPNHGVPSLRAGGEGMIDWQPIETAPKDGTTVLLWCLIPGRPDLAPIPTGGLWQKGMFHHALCTKAVPTHWAPINPPEGA